MSSTAESKPELKPSENGHTKPRFTFGQLFPTGVRETFVGPNKTGWATTGIYIGAAALCLGVTAGFAWLNKPAEIAEYGKVGQKFFAEFVDPTLATSLELSTVDANTVTPRQFKVEKVDSGQWVIPSHHNYPADAEDQLADTASSVIGVERGAMVTRWAADHAKYGVIDPRRDTLSVDEVEGVGQRLTLRGDNDSVLADFVVGNQVEGEFDQFYVRHPEEDEVYITTLDVDLSTRFTDWIDTDLFDLSSSDVRRVTVNDYSFDELSGSLTQSEITQLSREDSGNDWLLDSLDEQKEELNKDAIRDTLSEIANLEITGVRPKQKGLTPDLKLDRAIMSSQAGVERLQADLLSSGFLLQPAGGDDKDQLKLIAREGELLAGTKDGLVYRLHFGRVFTGSQEELEVGFVSTNATPNDSESESEEANATDETTESDTGADDQTSDEKSSSRPGRYVFVRVDFDKSLLGDEPAKPEEPVKPERLTELESEAAETAEDEENAGEQAVESDETELESDLDDSSSEESEESAEKEPSELEQLHAEHNTAKSEYESALKKYDDFQAKTKAGEEKAEELNRRFAKWYYVISGDSYDQLALSRDAFVDQKPDKQESGPETTEEETAEEATVLYSNETNEKEDDIDKEK
ncbi:DUF4340 domain-containing protein [Mariniblastus fucicola]|uniref:DUF4340 domain-containing protein n=1 Tax=Mariniblastus fucicola TaxID=980251 RepID=A0A5B9PJ65_9BACT|nr:DUF4340 domain-containing protein [Mariniblastus fucicola]QEG24696.1 hypothetical protein MFFC18_46170 [Mariniblastus fucicola]